MPAPLRVALVFDAAQEPRNGLTLRRDWRCKRFQYGDEYRAGPSTAPSYRARRDSVSDAGTDSCDEDWPSEGLERWATSMAVWDASEVVYPREDGTDDVGSSSGARKPYRRMRTKLGSSRSERRLAIGTQDGTVSIFQEKPTSKTKDDDVANLADAVVGIHAVESKTSIASRSSVGSARGHKSGRSELDTLSSPTAAIVSTSDAIASPTSPQQYSTGDAEEMLEEQWHAGEESSSVMGGAMHLLGLQDGHDHKGHKAYHAHTQSSSRLSSAPMSPSSSRRSHASSLSGLARPFSSLMSPSSSKTAARQSDGSDKRANPAANRRDSAASTSGTINEPAFKNKPASRLLEALEPLTTLQCSAPVPISGLEVVRSAGQADTMVVLQRNGTLTLCTLDERLSLVEIDLVKSKVVPLPDSDITANVTAPSPLMKLSALRSQAGSPAPGATRAQSNSGHPDAASNLPGVNLFTSLQLARDTEGRESPIALCFNENKKKAYVIDCAKHGLVAVKELPDIMCAVPACTSSEDDGELSILYTNKVGSLILTKVAVHRNTKLPRKLLVQSKASAAANEEKAAYLSTASTFLRREGFSKPTSKAPSIAGSAGQLSGVIDLGNMGIEKDAQGVLVSKGDLYISWSLSGISTARRVGDSTVAISRLARRGLLNVTCKGTRLALELRGASEMVDIDDDGVLSSASRSEHEEAASLAAIAMLEMSAMSPVACYRDGKESIVIRHDGRDLWSGPPQLNGDDICITASLPFSMERIALALSSGELIVMSLASIVAGELSLRSPTERTFLGTVCLLQVAQNTKTQSKFLLGGTEEGDVIAWDANTFELQRHLPLLTCSITAFVTFGQDDNVLRLHGCTLCVAADGAAFVLSLEGLKDLYVIPGRGAPLKLVAARANELLLLYADDRARVWDMGSLELRRSIGIEQAEALLDDGRGWWSRRDLDYLTARTEKTTGVLSAIAASRGNQAGAVTADVRRAVEAAGRMIAAGNDMISRQQSGGAIEGVDAEAKDGALDLPALDETILDISVPQAKRAAQTLRPLLRALLPVDLPPDLEGHVRTILDAESGSRKPAVKSGLFFEPSLLVTSASAPFATSREASAFQLLALIAMLNVLGKIKEYEVSCQVLIGKLSGMTFAQGNDIQTPSLMVLADYLLHSVVDIRDAAQTVFVATLQAVPQEQLELLCNQHGSSLPSVGDVEPSKAAQALLLLGLVATQRFTEMPPVLLKDIANSIVLYLADEQHLERQAIAIALCSRGFTIFQNYFDAMEVVRSLFALSSVSREGGTSSASITANGATAPNSATPSAEAIERRDLARAATLRIAEDNTPLFMTTLSHDILYARSPAHCSTTMRLVALMVRRKPHILYPNLPRLAEAVVKSLDPTMTAMRTVVHRSATIIISELITTYPTIAFHKETQRLAVGTFEGAIIMYDLKTATRLYVLEAHTASLNGLTFSNDGHRLVSLCLRDGMVKVWKTGTGFRSMFAFGSAPRQVASFLSGSRMDTAESKGQAPDQSGGNTAHSSQRPGATTPYKSFDFGHLAGAALASAATTTRDHGAGTSTYLHTTLGHASSPDALMHDLKLVRFEWLGERSVKIRVAEANMVFDVA